MAIIPKMINNIPIISVFRSFEIFLMSEPIVAGFFRDDFLELVRRVGFLRVVFLAIFLN